jgi:hypothetical protein
MIFPKIKIEASAKTRAMNALIERWDKFTLYAFDDEVEFAKLAAKADPLNWPEIAASIFRMRAGKGQNENM